MALLEPVVRSMIAEEISRIRAVAIEPTGATSGRLAESKARFRSRKKRRLVAARCFVVLLGTTCPNERSAVAIAGNSRLPLVVIAAVASRKGHKRKTGDSANDPRRWRTSQVRQRHLHRLLLTSNTSRTRRV